MLEIGAGLGVLTAALAEAVTPTGRVAALEIDPDLLPALEETVGPLAQVTVVPGDAMALDWPAFLTQQFGDAPVRAIANIPYNITTPLLAALLEHRNRLVCIFGNRIGEKGGQMVMQITIGMGGHK